MRWVLSGLGHGWTDDAPNTLSHDHYSPLPCCICYQSYHV